MNCIEMLLRILLIYVAKEWGQWTNDEGDWWEKVSSESFLSFFLCASHCFETHLRENYEENG